TTSYGIIWVQMVVYGLGMGLTSAPATESIMGAVSPRQAGVGSAVNDSTRLLGGTLGVAVIGSVFASLYGSRLPARLPRPPPPRPPPAGRAGAARRGRPPVGWRAAHRPPQGRRNRAPGPRPSRQGRDHERVPARPEHRLPGRRARRRHRGRAGGAVPAGPA